MSIRRPRRGLRDLSRATRLLAGTEVRATRKGFSVGHACGRQHPALSGMALPGMPGCWLPGGLR